MVTNRFGNKNFMQPNENAQGSLAFIFRFWRGEEGGGFFVFLLFPSSSSHVPQVPNVFAKTFPIAPLSLSHIVWSQLRCLWVGKEGQREAWQIMLTYSRECPVFQNSGDGPITWLLLKKIKKIGHTPHQLIEAWNKYPQFIMEVLAQAKNGDEQFWK
jgi:hypothetical protein